ncbi:MAG: hypothetical protein ACE5FM_03620 [Methyloligellaceae bacterium]
MGFHRHLIAGTALAALVFIAPEVSAQDSASGRVGNTTVTVGVGAGSLFLPDVRFGQVEDNTFNTTGKQNNNDFDGEYGLAVNGGVEFPANGMSGGPKTIAVQGFYSRIEDDSTTFCNGIAGTQRCGWAPIINNGSPKIGFNGGDDTTLRTDRDVDHWGISAEGRRHTGGGGGLKDGPSGKRRYVALGADIRGIDQDIRIRGNEVQTPANALTYTEDLDTTYYGVFAAYGGDYSLPFFSGMTSGMGLKSSFRFWGGIYVADTDYDGTYATAGPTLATVNQTLSLSEEEAAFIGGLTLETRKQLNPRTTISLRSDYTYYSYAPEMRYNDIGNTGTGPNVGTSISDDSAFSTRTTLRLTIKLGPREIMEPPLK